VIISCIGTQRARIHSIATAMSSRLLPHASISMIPLRQKPFHFIGPETERRIQTVFIDVRGYDPAGIWGTRRHSAKPPGSNGELF
jgi:hypothetical protein